MRFYEKKKPHLPRAGTGRVIKKFLWFPTKIGTETRWLETASILQVAVVRDSGTRFWCNRSWENNTGE